MALDSFIQQVYIKHGADIWVDPSIQNRHDLRPCGAYDIVREIHNKINNYSKV